MSVLPCMTNRGTLTCSMLSSGEMRSGKAQMTGSEPSPYSRRLLAWCTKTTFSRNVTKFPLATPHFTLAEQYVSVALDKASLTVDDQFFVRQPIPSD